LCTIELNSTPSTTTPELLSSYSISNIPETTTTKGLLHSQGEACRLAWQSLYLSVAVPIIKMKIFQQLDPSLERITVTKKLQTPLLTTVLQTDYVEMPTQCDGFPRKRGASTYTTVSTVTTEIQFPYTIKKGVSIPFSPHPTTFYSTRLDSASTLDCVIPKQECPKQWELYQEFMRSTIPDVEEYNAAYQFFKPNFENFSSPLTYTPKGNLWVGYENITGSGLLTGSKLLDAIVHITHGNGARVNSFFGGCREAERAAIKDCQAGLERLGKKFPFNFDELSADEAKALIIKHYGCSLQAAAALIIYPHEENLMSPRDVCENNSWGDFHTPATPREKDVIGTAFLPTFTWPRHWDKRK
jgi:hypothetical protein